MRALFLSFAALAFACGPLPFTTEMKGEAVIQGSPLGQFFNVFPPLSGFANLDFDQNQDFKNNDATRAMVKTMKVTSLTLRIVSPPSQDFSFLESLEFAVKSGDLEEKVASKTAIDRLGLAAPNPTLKLDVVNVDLAAFVHAPTMSIITRGTGHQPAQETRLEATVKFQVGL
ncbi:MAG: hypothetical protein Q8L48_17965 [Archangium sp.]|nr:hypothetical protein [Archangium sp.]